MSNETVAVDQADFDEMSMIAEQHTKKEDNVTCSDVRELREARARIVELELERDELVEYCEVVSDAAKSFMSCPDDIPALFDLRDLVYKTPKPKQSNND